MGRATKASSLSWSVMEGVDIHALEQVHRIVVARLMPVTASVMIHVGLVAGVFLLPAWTAPRESVVMFELVEPDAPPAPVVPASVKPDPRPLRPPKPIKAPPGAPPDPLREIGHGGRTLGSVRALSRAIKVERITKEVRP